MTPLAARCFDCGSDSLLTAGWDRLVCERCGTCWEQDGSAPRRVDSIACPGCPQRTVCRSRPSWLAESMTSRHGLRDGTPVVVRPLLSSDRDELAAGFEALSPEARRRRFLSAPTRLSEGDLEYLTNLDYDNHFALAAFTADEAHRGIGVARYVRNRKEPGEAEAAVTVAEGYRGRGVGTLLLSLLVEEAMRHGIRTFSGYVLWDNDEVLEPLQELGASVKSEGSGVARVDVDLRALVDIPHESVRSRLLRLLAR